MFGNFQEMMSGEWTISRKITSQYLGFSVLSSTKGHLRTIELSSTEGHLRTTELSSTKGHLRKDK